jgi:hypothetical protein
MPAGLVGHGQALPAPLLSLPAPDLLLGSGTRTWHCQDPHRRSSKKKVASYLKFLMEDVLNSAPGFGSPRRSGVASRACTPTKGPPGLLNAAAASTCARRPSARTAARAALRARAPERGAGARGSKKNYGLRALSYATPTHTHTQA